MTPAYKKAYIIYKDLDVSRKIEQMHTFAFKVTPFNLKYALESILFFYFSIVNLVSKLQIFFSFNKKVDNSIQK